MASLPLVEAVIKALPDLRVARHLVEAIQVGDEVWTYWSDGAKQIEKLPAPVQEYCASLRLYCDGTPGFGFHEADIRDPAATVQIADCDGALDTAYIYAEAGPGHTVKITDCDGNLVGYAVNRSACAPDYTPNTQITVKPNFKIVNNVAAPEITVAAPTVNVAPAAVTINEAAPSLVAASFDSEGKLTLTDSAGSSITAQIPTCS